ncbi:MAG: mannose-1-phosphate guanylyltransferase, partial [Nitrospinota bacterium]
RVMEEIKSQLPVLARGLSRIARAMGRREAREVMSEVYPKLPSISIDYGLMEGARGVSVIPAELSWHDLGSWAGLRELLPRGREGNLFLPSKKGHLLSLDSRNCLILCQKPLVATLGLEGLVIVETEDSLLVCPEERAQEVGRIVDELRRSGLGRFT